MKTSYTVEHNVKKTIISPLTRKQVVAIKSIIDNPHDYTVIPSSGSRILLSDFSKTFKTYAKIPLIALDIKRTKTPEGMITEIFNKDGTRKAYIPPEGNHPRRGTKKIKLNCWTFLLNWL